MNIVAAVLVLFSSFAIAFILINRESRHCVMLDNSIRLINLVKNRALNYAEPLGEIVLSLSESEEKFMKDFSSVFVAKKDLLLNFPDIWKTAVNEYFGRYLEQYECDILIHFGEELCSCSRSDIKNICEAAEYSLSEFSKTAKHRRNTSAKSTAAVSVSVGVMIVLMLI